MLVLSGVCVRLSVCVRACVCLTRMKKYDYVVMIVIGQPAGKYMNFWIIWDTINAINVKLCNMIAILELSFCDIELINFSPSQLCETVEIESCIYR